MRIYINSEPYKICFHLNGKIELEQYREASKGVASQVKMRRAHGCVFEFAAFWLSGLHDGCLHLGFLVDCQPDRGNINAHNL